MSEKESQELIELKVKLFCNGCHKELGGQIVIGRSIDDLKEACSDDSGHVVESCKCMTGTKFKTVFKSIKF